MDRSTWIDIKSNPPKDGQECLITDGTVVAAAKADLQLRGDGGIWWDPVGCIGYDVDLEIPNDDVTHYMPLPKPPVKKEN